MHTAAASMKAEASRVTGEPTFRAGRRPMRSVFWRIFLWFWLAMLLLAGAVAATIYLTDPNEFFPRQLSVPLQRLDRLAASRVEI